MQIVFTVSVIIVVWGIGIAIDESDFVGKSVKMTNMIVVLLSFFVS